MQFSSSDQITDVLPGTIQYPARTGCICDSIRCKPMERIDRNRQIFSFLIQEICTDIKVFSPCDPISVRLYADSGKQGFIAQDCLKACLRTDLIHIAFLCSSASEEDQQIVFT